MCYKKPDNGYSFAVTHCQYGKDVKWENRSGLIDSYSDDCQLEDGICYIKPPDGFNYVLTNCTLNK